MTAAINQLEEILGFELLVRNSHGVSLTRGGEQFLRHARTIIGAVNDAVRMPTRAPETSKGEVKLGVSYTVMGYFLPPLLLRFQRAHPEIEIKITEAHRRVVETSVANGPLDCGLILTSNLVNTDDLRYELLVKSQRRLWVSTGHELLKAEKVTFSDVVHQPYIALTVDEAWQTTQRYWSSVTTAPSPRLATSSVEAVRTLVGAGMGVTILSDMVYRPWSLDGHRIETIDVDETVPSMDVGFVWNGNRKSNPASELFLSFLKRTLKHVGS
jgi:DNA-binding transcriptional LysR family regulator